jgi:hypothetical protein
MARTPQTPFEIALTSFTSKDRINVFHAFAAVPVTQGTVVDVAGGLVDEVATTSDDADEHAGRTHAHAMAMGSKRFIAFPKLGHPLHKQRECTQRYAFSIATKEIEIFDRPAMR